MSLAVLANDMASRGRGEDSMLVHMTPHEVAGLQALAMKHGGSLTINPDTGLPEAGFLKSLLPMLAGIALGPAGFGLMSAGMAGLTVGGLTTLATGSLSRGLMAGMGAYGGAGLSEALAGAGEGALSSQISGEVARDKAAEIASGQLGEEEVGKMVSQRLKDTSGLAKMGAGLGAITESPATAMNFAKQNVMPLAAAAGPIMADAMVPTTTKMPTNTNPAYIRQYVTGDRPQAPRALAPVLASEWGSRSFQDAYAKPMATGGIVALADGGVPGYADGMLVNDQQVFDYFKGLDQSKLGSGALDAQIAADMQKYNVSAADIARITGTQGQQGDYEKRFVQAINKPDTSAQEFQAMTSDVGLQNQALANAMQNAGMSAAAQYAATHSLSDAGGIGGATNGITDPNNFYGQMGYKAGALPGDQGGLEGLYANINYSASGLQNLINTGKMSVADAQDAALAEMQRSGTSLADVKAATGKSFGDLFTPKKEEKKTTTTTTTDTGVVAGATKLPTATTYDNGAFGNYGSGNVTGTDYLGRTVSIATPGDIVTNPDQTRTVVPNIPGRTYGGFTGIDQLKSAYTAGGGSTGYVPKAPRTIAEFDQMYNTQTGDSLAAYNYLIGKGSYPTKSGVSEIMKPYEEAVLGYPTDLTKKKYINVNGKMVLNPQYVAPQTQAQKTAAATAAAKAGKADTIYVTNNRGESESATLGDDGNYHTSGGETYDVTGKQLAAMGGMMGFSVGGGLGSLGSYSDGGRLLKGPGDGVSDSIPATIGAKGQPARLADGEFVVPARIVSELGNGSTDAGAKKLYAMMDRVQKARGKTTGKNKVAANSRADKYLPA